MRSQLQSKAYLTAPHRNRLSKSILYLIRSGKLNKSASHLDFGCGHGFEFTKLRSLGYNSTGYDPHYFPLELLLSPRTRFDIVTCLHVINVVPLISVRSQIIQTCFDLCKKYLVVAARSPHPLRGSPYGDGAITRKGNFNKQFTHGELEVFIGRSLGISASNLRRIDQNSILVCR